MQIFKLKLSNKVTNKKEGSCHWKYSSHWWWNNYNTTHFIWRPNQIYHLERYIIYFKSSSGYLLEYKEHQHDYSKHCTKFPANLATFTKEIFNVKLHFLCIKISVKSYIYITIIKNSSTKKFEDESLNCPVTNATHQQSWKPLTKYLHENLVKASSSCVSVRERW